MFGGRPSGSCLLGGFCCISKIYSYLELNKTSNLSNRMSNTDAITRCSATVSLNNTYWQSPTTTVSAPSTCTLAIKLDQKFLEQKLPICQVRYVGIIQIERTSTIILSFFNSLDFVSFSIAQPIAGTCSDTFQIGGAINRAPTICGDNSGQHSNK